jgi:beta-lactamase regulating signal transducer with metallopeptidase domain
MIESIIHHLIDQGTNPDLMQRLAGSLLHFVWQGAFIAMVSAIILRLLSNRSAEWRYTVSVAALFLMLAAPIVTFMFYKQTGSITLAILQGISDRMQGSVQSAAQAATTATWTQWIVLAWFTGVLICSLRLIAGWRLSVSLSRVGTSRVPSHIQHTFHEIKARLAMTRPVRLLASLRIDTPVAVGWLRPAILLPVTALTGLNEGQLRAVLSHELAHIRRHDFLVNSCSAEWNPFFSIIRPCGGFLRGFALSVSIAAMILPYRSSAIRRCTLRP